LQVAEELPDPQTPTDDEVEFDAQACEFDSDLAQGWLSYTFAM